MQGPRHFLGVLTPRLVIVGQDDNMPPLKKFGMFRSPFTSPASVTCRQYSDLSQCVDILLAFSDHNMTFRGSQEFRQSIGNNPDTLDGPLSKRRFGLRVDDEVIVYIVGGDLLRVVKGRVLEHKKGLHLVDEEGHYHRISYDWVTDIIVLRHNRPAAAEDPELRRKPATQPKTKAAKAAEAAPTDQAYQ